MDEEKKFARVFVLLSDQATSLEGQVLHSGRL